MIRNTHSFLHIPPRARYQVASLLVLVIAGNIAAQMYSGTWWYWPLFIANISTIAAVVWWFAGTTAHKESRLDETIRAYERLNQFYSLMTHVGDAVLRVQEPRTLYEEVCRIAVDDGPFAMVWVGIEDTSTSLVRLVASAGDRLGYVDRITVSSREDLPEGRGPVGTAIRENRYLIVDDTEQDERFLPWLEAARKSGYRSVAAFPVRTGKAGRGVIAFYADKPHRFTKEEIDLLDRMSANLSFALHSAELEQQRKEAEKLLREAENKYRSLVEQLPAITYVADVNNFATLYVSPQIESVLGFRLTDWMRDPGKRLAQIHPDDRERVLADLSEWRGRDDSLHTEYRMLTASGKTIWLRDDAALVRDNAGNPLFFQGMMTDITSQKAAEEQLRHAAFHDALTGLPNRNLFMDRLEHALNYSRRHEEFSFAVLFLDLDRFKIVNDSLGHLAGDTLIAEAGRRLAGMLRPNDTIARFGGDEFVILAEDVKGMSGALMLAERAQREMMRPLDLGGNVVSISASIGIVLSTGLYERPEELLRDADIAMYRAKAKGKACYEIFDASMHAEAVEFLRLEIDIRRAVEEKEFEVYYQPIVSLADGRVAGAEALLRWNHPERGILYPDSFMKAAEETGQIIVIGEQVFKQVCADVRSWQEAGLPSINVAVNIAASQYHQKGLADVIGHVLRTSELDPACLKIELTESSVMENVRESVETLERLSDIGVRIAIDDFGTGYSSLAYLKRFPIDTLKVDRSFVRDIPEDKDDAGIITAIIAMAEQLGLEVVAEGVETREQLDFLREMGCDYVQGYIFSRAVPADTFARLLAEDRQMCEGR